MSRRQSRASAASNAESTPAPLDPLIKKSIVARDYRGVTSRHLRTLIERGEWPAPDIKATRKGEADYYFRSTAERARADFIKAALKRSRDAERSKARTQAQRADRHARQECRQ